MDVINNMHIIIPLSGLGSRFIAEGYKDPKPLILVDGKPMVEHVVNLFPGETKITFIANDKHLKETSMNKILRSIVPNCTIREVSSENRQGPVDAVFQIVNMIDDNEEVIVSYCDYGTEWDYKKFLSETREKNADGAIAYYTGFHPHLLGSDKYAFMKDDGSNNLIEIKEKEMFGTNKFLEKASNGTYYFKTGKILKHYFQKQIALNERINNEFYVSMTYNLLVKDGLKVHLYEIQKMLQWGTPKDLEIYQDWSNYFHKRYIKQTKYSDTLNTTLILPMAGKGSRFSIEGYELPKPLLPIHNNPMIVEAVNNLPETSRKIFICLDEHKTYNIEQILKNNYTNTECMFINNVTQGQACTCEIGINQYNIDLEKPILISACDNGVYYNQEEYQELLNDENNDVIVWGFKNNQASVVNPNMYAWLKIDEDNNIQQVSCKKYIFNDDPRKHSAIIGTMFFRKTKYFIDGLKACYKKGITTNKEYYVDNVLNENIESGLRVKLFNVEHYLCWGTPGDYKTYNYWNEYFNK